MRWTLILLALASCAEVSDAEHVPFRVGHTWRFPAGLNKPTPHWFPYSLPDKEDAP